MSVSLSLSKTKASSRSILAPASARCGAIILAAGVGKRMQSSLPKVLHCIGGRPMLVHILRKIKAARPDVSVAVVLGHQAEKIEKALREEPELSDLDLHFVLQSEQKGTGHAARVAMESDWGAKMLKEKAQIAVFPGDLPLLSQELVSQVLSPLKKTDALRLLTCDLVDPHGYGRVVRRGKQGAVLRIVEEKDASDRERQIKEVACSIYTFQSAFLKVGLSKLSNKNAQKEYYLTDLVSQASSTRRKIEVLKWRDEEDLRGINDPWELAQARQIFKNRCVKKWSLSGVQFMDPSSVWIDCEVILGKETIVYPGVILMGKTTIGDGSILGPRCLLKDVSVGSGVELKQGTVAERSVIRDGAVLGPYAHLRPESEVGQGAKIGNFVELKKSKIGSKTSIAHLSYVGDAEVGNNVNLGCGFITCNFDGREIDGSRKHKSIIEDEVFMGSDCQIVAPIKIGKGAYVASGSTITKDVEPDSLAIARTRQENKPGYAKKLRGP